MVEHGDRVRVKKYLVGAGDTGIAHEGASKGHFFVETNPRDGTGAYYHESDLEVIE